MASIAEILQAAAQKYGIPLEYLTRSAQIESSMNPNATTRLSSAKGLFQILDREAKRYGINPFDPAQNTDVAARMAVENRAFLRQHLGREPTAGELYLAHQQGPTGAVALLTHPNAAADTLVPRINITNNGGVPGEQASHFANRYLARFRNSATPTVLASAMPANPAVPTAVDAAMSPNPLSEMHPIPPKQPEPLAIPKDKQLFPYSASGTQPQTYANPGIDMSHEPNPPTPANPAGGAPQPPPTQQANGGLGGMLGNPFMLAGLFNALRKPAATVQPQVPQRSLDLASLFAELSPNLVLGRYA